MRIAQVAPLFESVPPQLYGGTERIVSYVTDELVRRGHEVTLFASGDSRTTARLVPVVERATRLDAATHDLLGSEFIRELGLVFSHASDFDVIHCHVDYLAFPFHDLTPTPTVHTIHGRLDLPHLLPVYRQFRTVPLVSISDAQRAPLDQLGVRWAGTVYHGLPVERYAFAPEDQGYLAFLGRLAPEKQPELAIEIARRVGLPLKIAAKVDAVDQEYFDQVVAPLLDDPLVEFLGEIGDDQKSAFLGGAKALLFPIDWPEPFGLVMIEAMACGTPVVARPCGSVPEVIDHGRTGFLASTLVELTEAVKRLDEIDRAECRRQFELRFSAGRMAQDYERIYGRLASRRRAA
ncbi:MAG TPA: glycosyltransferase family 4 protein [Candidatus Acidoferrum sp.]|jgi:glycosyltransferase involved in cell wall biosynthesis|nr:glycosyltransferase family 4 protein [Candidatus Acidoferrum sp.]